MIADLDHVAIGVDDVAPHLRRLVHEFGGTVVYGSHWPGCRWVVTRLGDAASGMNLELLEPWQPEQDAFLVRFLAARGCGPNHITFVVEDVEALLARLETAGLVPAKQRLGDPIWREAFLHPRDACGTVVQIADTTNNMSLKFCFERARCAAPRGPESVRELGWEPGEEGWWEWPGERGAETVVLERVVLASDDLQRSRWLYSELLGGTIAEDGPAALELVWAGGGRLRFERHLDRPPGVIRLDCSGLPATELELAGTTFCELAAPRQ